MDNVIDIRTKKPIPTVIRVEMSPPAIINNYFSRNKHADNPEIQLALHLIRDLLSTIHTIEIAAHCFAIDDGVLETEPNHPLNQIIELCKEVSDCE